jgi:hypothetical protein
VHLVGFNVTICSSVFRSFSSAVRPVKQYLIIQIILIVEVRNSTMTERSSWNMNNTSREIYALLGYNATSSGNILRTFRYKILVPSSRVKNSKKSSLRGTDTLSRNVGKGLPLDAALYPRRAQISSASRRKLEITNNTLLYAPRTSVIDIKSP